jgi:hypothetical protein
MSGKMKLITAISGGHKFPNHGPVGAREGHIVSFGPHDMIVATDEHPVELIVTGYEGPEDENRAVHVQLKRTDSDAKFPGALLWEAYVNRQGLGSKPALVEETL